MSQERVILDLDERGHGSFFLYEGDQQIGEMKILLKEKLLTVLHTEVDPLFAGKGKAKLLLDHMVAHATGDGLKVRPLCPYVLAEFKRHPDTYGNIWHLH
ncbi:hypothetical protein CLV98_103181 [Dyadobacter jejuensis]|uniref:N-acetyltransferase domain-containing protein n=1 Tax=Dyadobacter jejuensis TaxID=1082580 RepID=A0A316ANU6_9BACT|nr:GNAT family N-acetyltransferase [Dyadobacter jejuensis]PWJ58814.1 hypothetical protein CLV98_103181 [Dyadobacter jejuensis]